MTSRFFEFGQTLPEYPVPVLNERAVRASAGILFVFAFAAFAQALLLGNFHATQVFVVAFIIEFAIRLFVNPRWAPAMIVGQWVVRGQVPEYVGAPQKRFAWSIGLGLGLWMFYLIVIERVISPINMLVCGTCLLLMFFESAFGICVGCKLYNWLRPEQAQLCPGGACAYTPQRALAAMSVMPLCWCSSSARSSAPTTSSDKARACAACTTPACKATATPKPPAAPRKNAAACPPSPKPWATKPSGNNTTVVFERTSP